VCFVRLVAERKAAHTRLDAQDVVVHREHLLQRGGGRALDVDRHLGVINAREVAGAGWLVLLWLQREAVAVHTWVWHTAVVHVWLVLVEVLTLLLLEAVLAVEHQLEVVQRADLDTGRHWGTLLDPPNVGGQAGTGRRLGQSQSVGVQTGSTQSVGQTSDGIVWTSIARHVHVRTARGEVPQAVVRAGCRVLVAPNQLLHWVVERQTDGLSRGSRRGSWGG